MLASFNILRSIAPNRLQANLFQKITFEGLAKYVFPFALISFQSWADFSVFRTPH